MRVRFAKNQKSVTYHCSHCGVDWEFSHRNKRHYCDPDKIVDYALETRRFDLLQESQRYLELKMRRVTGIKHSRFRKGDPDPNLWAFRKDNMGEQIREIASKYFLVIKAHWGLS